MSNYLTKNLMQTAVYWGTPTAVGDGGYTYATAVEIDVRWIEKQELFIDANGNEIRSQAVVLMDQAVDLGGWLYLGDLSDVASSDAGSPGNVDGAFPIKGKVKVPNVKGTSYYYKVWL